MDQLSSDPSSAGVQEIVTETFAEVAREQGVKLGALAPDTRLIDMALDSLCLAVIVARLEERLGGDPFAAEDVELPASFGDFVALYERARAVTQDKHAAAGRTRDHADA